MMMRPRTPDSAGRDGTFDVVGVGGTGIVCGGMAGGNGGIGSDRGANGIPFGAAVEKAGSSTVIVPWPGALRKPTGRISLATGRRCG